MFVVARKAKAAMTHPNDMRELPSSTIKAESAVSILGTHQEAQFDHLAELAAAICWTPISQVTLLDEEWQYVKGSVGLDGDTASRDNTFCNQTVKREDSIFIVNDAESDPRFAHNPLVTGHPHIRFYAGVPLFSPAGEKVGALCVVDTIKRELKSWQVRALLLLAQQANARIELRMRQHSATQLFDRSAENGEILASIVRELPFACYVKDRQHRLTFYNSRVAEHFGISAEEWLGKTCHEMLPKALADRMQAAEEETFTLGRQTESVFEVPTCSGSTDHWKMHYVPCRVQGGESMLAVMMLRTDELRP